MVKNSIIRRFCDKPCILPSSLPEKGVSMSIFKKFTGKKRRIGDAVPCLFCAVCLFLCAETHFSVLFAQETGRGRILLLDFSSEQCPACQIVKPLLTELARKNYPIQRVDGQNPADQELYRQYNITTMPSYVILLDSVEVDRFISQGEGIGLLKPQLLRMFEQTYEKMKRSPPPATVVPGPVPAAVQPQAAAADDAQEPSAISSVSAILPGLPADSALLGVTVRIRAGNRTSSDCGTGTLIHSNTKNGTNEGLILTCGHLFRDSGGKGPVQVELFDPVSGQAKSVVGECVWYNDDLDIGFVGVPLPGPMKAARIVPPGFLLKRNDRVVSIGCTAGDTPSVWNHTVVSTDQKFYQPQQADSTASPFYYIEVDNAPKQGRSGGGLFTQAADGEYYLVGLCNAADPQTNEGYFLPSGVIYDQLLSNRNLAFVYEDLLRAQSDHPIAAAGINQTEASKTAGIAAEPDLSLSERMEPVSTASEDLSLIPGAVMTPKTLAASPAASIFPSASAQTAVSVSLAADDSAVSPVGFQGSPRFDPVPTAAGAVTSETDSFSASMDELKRMHAKGAEIICIVSWPDAPDGPKESEVIRLNPAPNPQ